MITRQIWLDVHGTRVKERRKQNEKKERKKDR